MDRMDWFAEVAGDRLCDSAAVTDAAAVCRRSVGGFGLKPGIGLHASEDSEGEEARVA